MTRIQAHRLASNIQLLGWALIDPRSCLRPKCFFAAGAAYQLLPVDLIPNRIFLVGYLDNVAILAAGAALAWITIPAGFVAVHGGPALTADLVAARRSLGRAGLRLRQRLHDMSWHLRWRGRSMAASMLGLALGRVVLRLTLGRAATRADLRAFRMGLRQEHVLLPPMLRALAAVPDASPVLTRAMLGSWLLADPAYEGVIRRGLDPGVPGGLGDRLRVWSRAPVSFLHLEKTAGTSLVAALSSRFHPAQIDQDPQRASPPHLVAPFSNGATARAGRAKLVWGHYDLPSLHRLDRNRFVFTLLREPRERLLSLYYFWRSLHPDLLGPADDNPQVRHAHRLGLLEFLQCEDPVLLNFTDDLYARRLLGLYARHGTDPLRQRQSQEALGAALAALDAVDFVGITEQTSLSVARLGTALGIAGLEEARHLNRGSDATRSPDFRPVPRETMTPAIAAALDRRTMLDQVLYRRALQRFQGGG